MAKHVKRSVIPIYLVGVVWLAFGLFSACISRWTTSCVP